MQKELFTWSAQLADGTQIREEGGKNNFKKIIDENKKGNVKYFYLIPQIDTLRPVLMKLGGKRKLIFWRRRIFCKKDISFNWTLHIIGWEENVRGVSIKHKLFIYPNGNVESNNDEPTLIQPYMDSLEKQLRALKSNTMANGTI